MGSNTENNQWTTVHWTKKYEKMCKERQLLLLQSWKSNNYMRITRKTSIIAIVHHNLFCILGAPIIFSPTISFLLSAVAYSAMFCVVEILGGLNISAVLLRENFSN